MEVDLSKLECEGEIGCTRPVVMVDRHAPEIAGREDWNYYYCLECYFEIVIPADQLKQ